MLAVSVARVPVRALRSERLERNEADRSQTMLDQKAGLRQLQTVLDSDAVHERSQEHSRMRAQIRASSGSIHAHPRGAMSKRLERGCVCRGDDALARNHTGFASESRIPATVSTVH